MESEQENLSSEEIEKVNTVVNDLYTKLNRKVASFEARITEIRDTLTKRKQARIRRHQKRSTENNEENKNNMTDIINDLKIN